MATDEQNWSNAVTLREEAFAGIMNRFAREWYRCHIAYVAENLRTFTSFANYWKKMDGKCGLKSLHLE